MTEPRESVPVSPAMIEAGVDAYEHGHGEYCSRSAIDAGYHLAAIYTAMETVRKAEEGIARIDKMLFVDPAGMAGDDD